MSVKSCWKNWFIEIISILERLDEALFKSVEGFKVECFEAVSTLVVDVKKLFNRSFVFNDKFQIKVFNFSMMLMNLQKSYS